MKLSLMNGRLQGIKYLRWILSFIVLCVIGSVLTSGNILPTPQPESNQSALEARLAHVLSTVKGAGAVEVIVHTADAPVSVQAGTFGASASVTEKVPIGVIVVAAGAEDLQVRLALARAVQTLLELPISAVEVLPKQTAQVGGQ